MKTPRLRTVRGDFRRAKRPLVGWTLWGNPRRKEEGTNFKKEK